MATRQRQKLTASERSRFGSRENRRLRREGFVPGVVYGGGSDARPFQVPERELRTMLQRAGALFDLELNGDTVPVVVKEEQRHPLRGELIHLDLLEVKLDVEIQSEVALELEGTEDAPGAKEGGVLEHVTRELTVEALPTAIPEQITVDVSEMEIGDTVQLSAVTPPEGVTFVVDDPDEVTVATLNPPPVIEEPEAEVEEEAELVGEEGELPEGAEPAVEDEATGEAAPGGGESGGGGRE